MARSLNVFGDDFEGVKHPASAVDREVYDEEGQKS